jgi:hypothetical protein
VAVASRARREDARGVSLVGLLMMVVVLGAMGATAVIGVSSLTGGGGGGVGAGGAASQIAAEKAAAAIAGGAKVAPGGITAGVNSACRATADAAQAASAVAFANGGGTFPAKWSDLTAGNPPVYALPQLAVVNGGNPKELDGRGWKLLMSGGGATRPTFTCS